MTQGETRQIAFTVAEIIDMRTLLEVALKAIGRQAVMPFAVLDRKLETALSEAADNDGLEPAPEITVS